MASAKRVRANEEPGKKRGRAPKSADTEREEVIRQRIIRAAAEVYREHGYERAGMADIARSVGLTAPALYWYFHSKEEILVAFLEHTIRDLIDSVRSRIVSTEPQARLREFMSAYVSWQLHQQELSAAYERIYALGHLRNSLPDAQRQRIKALEQEFYGLCRDLVAAVHPGHARPREAGAVAFALIGMVEHLISWFRPSGTLSVKQTAELYADLAVAMATASPSR